MIKFFTVFLVLFLATTVHSQGDSGNNNAVRPLLFEYLKDTGVDDLVMFGCAVKDTLSDREVSDHIYKITGGLVKDVVKKGMACIKPIVFGVMNDHNSAIGKAVTNFRMGNQAEITRFSDLFSGIPRGILLFPYILLGGFQTMAQQIDYTGIEREMDSIWKQIEEQCHTQEFDELQANLDFVSKRFQEKIDAAGLS